MTVDPPYSADYQRALPLPDGRTWWTFQDAFVKVGDKQRLLHNVAAIQVGGLWRLLTGPDNTAFVSNGASVPRRRWFWPLDSSVDSNGNIRTFYAECEERGDHYLDWVAPIATWVATFDPNSSERIAFRKTASGQTRLYGWSIVDGVYWTYLYGHCWRQFGWSFLGHAACATDVYVARVPLGRFDEPYQYWNGTSWSPFGSEAVPILDVAPERMANPIQVTRANGAWIGLNKYDDWWGQSIELLCAPAPTGPWGASAVIDAPLLGPSDTHNSYFASFCGRTDETMTIGISNNRWSPSGSPDYHPTFHEIPIGEWLP